MGKGQDKNYLKNEMQMAEDTGRHAQEHQQSEKININTIVRIQEDEDLKKNSPKTYQIH